jgi:hypothetical protein
MRNNSFKDRGNATIINSGKQSDIKYTSLSDKISFQRLWINKLLENTRSHPKPTWMNSSSVFCKTQSPQEPVQVF